MIRQLCWSVFLSVLLPMANAVADPFQGAQWIRDPRFAGEQVLGVFAAQGAKQKSTVRRGAQRHLEDFQTWSADGVSGNHRGLSHS